MKKVCIAMLMIVVLVSGVVIDRETGLLQVNASDSASTSFYSEGASVAVNTDTALMRFGFLLNTEGTQWTDCFEKGQIKEGYTAGVLCLPYDLSNKGANLTLENELVAKAQLTNWQDASEEGKKISYVQLNANQIPEGQEHRTLIVKGYIADAKGIVSYTEPVKASMSYVAYKNQGAFTDEQKALYLKEHNVTVVSAKSEEEVTSSYTYGTKFSDITSTALYKDAACTTEFTNSYVSGKTKVYCEQFIDEGLAFMADNGGSATENNQYTVNANRNQITVQDDWLTPKITAANGVKDFEVSATYANLVSRAANSRYGFKIFQDNVKQYFYLKKVDSKTYTLILHGGYTFESNVQLTSTEDINQLKVTLKRVGEIYTLSAYTGNSTAEWTFNAYDKLDGTNTFESKFATKVLSNLHLAPVLSTTGITIESWSFTNLDKDITQGLAFMADNGGSATENNQYTVNANRNQITVQDDWLTPKITAANGVKDFEVSATYANLVGRAANSRYGFKIFQDDVKQYFYLKKVDSKTYTLILHGGYTFESNVQLTSTEDVNQLKVTLKRVGEVYTLSAYAGNSTAEWTFNAYDKLDGTNTFESKFATKVLSNLHLAPVLSAIGTTIESWSFANLDANLDQYADAVYLSSRGNDNYTGKDCQHPYATLSHALDSVKDGGTIVVYGSYAVPFDFEWVEDEADSRKINIVGYTTDSTLDFTRIADNIIIGNHVKFDNLKLVFGDSKMVFANGHKLEIGMGVTIDELIKLYGGGYQTDVATTDITVLNGNYYRIYGGGYDGAVSGDTNVYIGGITNSKTDPSSHDDTYNIYGGGLNGDVGGTAKVTFTGDAKANYIYGGSGGTGKVKGTCIIFAGGKTMSLHGGNYTSSGIESVNVQVTGGEMEQLFGANQYASMAGNVVIELSGGKITRRVYGGCYNEVTKSGLFSFSWSSENYVTGEIHLKISSGVTISLDAKDSSGDSYNDRSIYACSRYEENHSKEICTITFMDKGAYETYNGKLGSEDWTMDYIMSRVSDYYTLTKAYE